MSEPTEEQISERVSKLSNEMHKSMVADEGEIQWDMGCLKDEWMLRKLAEMELNIEALTK